MPHVHPPARQARLRGTVLCLSLLCGLPTLAQTDAQHVAPRYELGRRVRAFEIDRAVVADPAIRRRATPALEQAVNSFFALALGEAARHVTEASFTLRRETPTDAAELWAASLAVAPAYRMLDRETDSLTVSIAPFYEAGQPPPDATLQLELGTAGHTEAPIRDQPVTLTLDLRGLEQGDQTLTATVRVATHVLAEQTQTIAVVDHRDDRLKAVARAIAAWPESPRTTLRESARLLHEQLARLASGATLELDVPAAQRLAELEALIAADAAAQAGLGPERPGNLWLALATPDGRRSVPCRLLVPVRPDVQAPAPLVVALHGAGGTENLFFESYGAGAIVGECRRRGWFLLAPRSPLGSAPVPELIDELARLYPIDRQRVFLIGHSMGAAQVVATAGRDPARFHAVAALGGGGTVHPRPELQNLPFLVAVGTSDFALAGARRLVRDLRGAGVARVDAREFQGVEHLAIVQDALPDVFAFFDSVSD